MSINRAMQSGVTALSANAAALANISNNIANSNTTGFKRVMTNFTNLVTGNTTVSTYASNGVTASVQQSLTNRGELNSSNAGYSLGLDGQGFFVTSPSSDTVTAGSDMLFTRDGSFSTDTKGYLKNAAGLYLMGWPADSSGNIDTNATDITKLAPINVSNITNKAEATTAANFTANIDSNTPISTAAADSLLTPPGPSAYSPTTQAGAMSAYDATTNMGTKPDSTISMTVSDSLGQQHTVTVSLLKIGVDTTAGSPTLGKTKWSYEISSPDVDTGASPDLHQLQTGNLFFDSNGNLDMVNSTPNTTGTFDPTFTVGASSGTPAVGAATWNSSFGAAAQDIDLGFGSTGTSTLTQLAGDSTTTAMSVNGTEFGALTKVSIDKDGMVNAIYNNGDVRKLGQVAVATFINANGLTPVTGNAFAVSSASGGFSLKQPGEGGAGSLSPDSLEASTVDLGEEFTSLITTQRAYSAASKIITTADDMLQELLQIKR